MLLQVQEDDMGSWANVKFEFQAPFLIDCYYMGSLFLLLEINFKQGF